MKPPRHPPSVARRMAGAAIPTPAGSGFGGLFEGLQKLAEAMQSLSHQGESSLGTDGKVVFGYSIRTAAGETHAEPFGHVPPTQPTTAEVPPRQPIVDVFEDADAIRVIAEMPGVGAGDLRARVEDGALVLKDNNKRWHKRVVLPGPVDAAGLTLAARHGIVEVRLPRARTGG